MKILQAHTEYVNSPGGEDIVLEMERDMLAKNGHTVIQLLSSNQEMRSGELLKTAKSGIEVIWSNKAFNQITNTVRLERPDIVHVHNTFSRLSPSIFWAIKREQIPTILTLHNYRITCARSTLFRNNSICVECVGRLPLPALLNKCRYNNSLPAGLVIALTQAIHFNLKTYNKIDAFIVLNEFSREIFVQSGLPEERIFVKPNFIESAPLLNRSREKRIVFVGQISVEKGVDLLLAAWVKLPSSEYQLLIIGDGPERCRLQSEYSQNENVKWMGRLPHQEVMNHISESRYLVAPSRWYEPFGMVVIEAFSQGTPVIVPNHGPFRSIVKKGQDAIVYEGSLDSLVDSLESVITQDVAEWDNFSQAALSSCRERYSPEQNYNLLMDVYDFAKKHTLENGSKR